MHIFRSNIFHTVYLNIKLNSLNEICFDDILRQSIEFNSLFSEPNCNILSVFPKNAMLLNNDTQLEFYHANWVLFNHSTTWLYNWVKRSRRYMEKPNFFNNNMSFCKACISNQKRHMKWLDRRIKTKQNCLLSEGVFSLSITLLIIWNSWNVDTVKKKSDNQMILLV